MGKDESIDDQETTIVSTRTDDHGRGTASLSELVHSLIADASLLLRREAELATIELKGKATKAGIAAGILGAAAFAGFLSVATFTAAAVLALSLVLPAWAAALIVGAVWLVVAVVLTIVGRDRFREVGPLAPRATIETVQEDIGWMRRETERLTTTE